MINEDKKGIKIVGSRPLENYVNSLSNLLDGEEPKALQQTSLSNLLEKENLLFSKEIEVMYDVEKSDLQTFIEQQLIPGTYEEQELLGGKYFIKVANL